MNQTSPPVGRRQRIARYREIVGVLTDERPYELVSPGGINRLFEGPTADAATPDPDSEPIERRIRRAMERLGPAFVKAGQLPATTRLMPRAHVDLRL